MDPSTGVVDADLIGSDPANVPIVRVNPSGLLPPVVFFHTWGLEADNIRRLGARLGPDRPLIGIEHPPPEGPLPADFDGWVRHHRQAFDELDLRGPHHLAGFSFGGIIALEIARQLLDEGEEVAWLGLVDTIRPKRNPQRLGPYLRYHLQELLDQPDPEVRRAHLRRMVLGGGKRSLLRARHQALRPLRRLHLFPPSQGPTLADQRGLAPLKKAVWRGYLTHRPTPYDEPVALFTGAENRLAAAGDPSLRWAKYLRGGFEVTRLPGRHREILATANVDAAAAAIAASLDRAEARRVSNGEVRPQPW
ncbi:hypothetical protein BH10ACT1_BH10ACT1_05230 [soil metagenome]